MTGDDLFPGVPMPYFPPPDQSPGAQEVARIRLEAAVDAVHHAFNNWLNSGAGDEASAMREIMALQHRLVGVWGACFGGGDAP